MKKYKILILLMMVVFMTGCNNKKNIEIYQNNVPLYEENKTISTLELDEIYEIFEYGFGGSKLFDYLNKKNINKYRLSNTNESFLYTCISVEKMGILYVFLEENEYGYMVSHLLFKCNHPIYMKEDFDNLKMGESKIDDVIKIDENLKYNTLYTSSVGTITTHVLADGTILQIYYSTNLLQQITYMKYEKKENSVGYIRGIHDIDWL